MEILLTDYGLHSRSLRLNPRQEPNTDNKTETSLTRVATILFQFENTATDIHPLLLSDNAHERA
jgi:hypothetical protein